MNTPTPFHVLTPLLKQVESEGWSIELIDRIDYYLVKIDSIKLIQLFLRKGFFPSEKFVYYASMYGNLRLLQFAKEHQFPCGKRAFYFAIQNGRLDILDHLFQSYPEFKNELYAKDFVGSSTGINRLKRCFSREGKHSSLDSFIYLFENGFREWIVRNGLYQELIMGTDICRAIELNDYSFSFTLYLYRHQISDNRRISRFLERFIKNKYIQHFDIGKQSSMSYDYHYRAFFDGYPEFRHICFDIDIDISKFPVIQEKVIEIKEMIKIEKEESKVLKESFPSDVLRYVVWNYL